MSISADLFAGMSFRLFSVFLILRTKPVMRDREIFISVSSSDVHALIPPYSGKHGAKREVKSGMTPIE